MEQLRTKIDKVLEIILISLFSFMVINVLWQVASRYIFNSPSPFTDELSRYILIWVGLLGAAYTTGQSKHVAIDMIENKFSEETLAKLNLLMHIIVSLFALVAMVIGGARLVLISLQLEQTSSALHIPLGYVYTVVPLSGLLIAYYSISDFKTSRAK